MSSAKRKLSEPNSVSKSLFDLKDKGTLCDVQLHLQGSTISAHACVLASCSSYFLELFKLNQEIHWCARNPLVIDLENLLDNSKDLCVICVSKIIDFMYLRELVFLQDHYEHFVVINKLFQVFDSVPLGKNCKKTNFYKPLQFESSTTENHPEKSRIVQINKNGTADLLSKQAPCVQSVVADVSSNCSLAKKLCSVANGAVKRSESDSGTSKCTLNIAVTCKVNPKLENMSYKVTASDSGASAKLATNVVKETDVKKTCEFMCCNPEPEINSSLAKLRKRRKMFCELCDFSSVSISKILQHLQSTDHFQITCPICLRKVTNTNDLKEHFKDHADSKPFICQICNKRNRYWDYHKMHLKIHCRNKSFYCDLCQRGFVSKRSLTEHLTSHKGSYLCKKCDYYTSDLKMYRSHLLEHGKEDSKNDWSSEFHFYTHPQSAEQKVRKFQCQVCGEGFTQKKNLARHVKLKHFVATKFSCSLCAFVSDRIDLLSIHMKKKHSCTLVKEKKKCSTENKIKKDNQKLSEFVSVLIPIQLVSENASVNAFVPECSGRGLAKSVNTKHNSNQCNSLSNTHAILNQNPDGEIGMSVESKVTVDSSIEHKSPNDSFTVSSDYLQDKNRSITESTRLEKDSNKADQSEIINADSIQASFMSVSHSFNMDIESAENPPQTLNDGDFSEVEGSNNIDQEKAILEGNQYIWLNEATGELLNDETLTNIQSQNICKANQKVLGTENSALEFCDQLKNSMLSEASGECSTLDLKDEIEEWQFPQTPQTNLVGIDDCDNLFSWNQIDNSFYSTWVLNETTGELNMVSFFSIQSVRNPSEIKLGENSESLAPLEDDDTALFLNEGTGDLSVIYFNPTGPERDDFNIHPCEKPCHDNLETLSDISDDDSNFLNEEFMRASANFMSFEENEKFLNELTGEFDIAKLNNYQPEVLNNQVSGNESYLNEETGEISWNIMDDNDLFTKPDGLEYDLDDSLNCEDFEPFFSNVSGFSSQFCLDEASNNWQSADEANDALVLNECTGELVKKS